MVYFITVQVPYSPSDEIILETKEQLEAYLIKQYKTPEKISEELKAGRLSIMKGKWIKDITIKETKIIKSWELK